MFIESPKDRDRRAFLFPSFLLLGVAILAYIVALLIGPGHSESIGEMFLAVAAAALFSLAGLITSIVVVTGSTGRPAGWVASLLNLGMLVFCLLLLRGWAL
jgi:hypothetical protein